MTEIPFIINPQKPPQGMETYEEKAWRKVKEQPLVPLGPSALSPQPVILTLTPIKPAAVSQALLGHVPPSSSPS